MLNNEHKAKLDNMFQSLLRTNPSNFYLLEIIRSVPYLATRAYNNLENKDQNEVIYDAITAAHRSENHDFVVLLWSRLQFSLDTKICEKLLNFYKNDCSDLVRDDYKSLLSVIRKTCQEWQTKESCGQIVDKIINYHHVVKYKQ